MIIVNNLKNIFVSSSPLSTIMYAWALPLAIRLRLGLPPLLLPCIYIPLLQLSAYFVTFLAAKWLAALINFIPLYCFIHTCYLIRLRALTSKSVQPKFGLCMAAKYSWILSSNYKDVTPLRPGPPAIQTSDCYFCSQTSEIYIYIFYLLNTRNAGRIAFITCLHLADTASL